MSEKIIKETAGNFISIIVNDSGEGVYRSFYTDGKKIFRLITGGESCQARHKKIIETEFSVPWHHIKTLYPDCKKHNAISVKITGREL